MDENTDKQLPCIVGSGVVTSKKDMIRVLRGFDHVKFIELIDNNKEFEDEAFIVEVFSSDAESTIFFNRRIHINVKNFEYLRIKQSQPAIVELIDSHRVIRLESLNDPLTNKEMLMNEAIENRADIDSIYEEEDILLDEDF